MTRRRQRSAATVVPPATAAGAAMTGPAAGRRRWVGWVAAASLLVALTGLITWGVRHARGAAAYRDAPVVLISIDTLRSDHLPVYGYRAVETPAIDALRRDAVLFGRAYSNVPLTLPSHVSMFSGLLPPVHGVRDNAGFVYKAGESSDLPSLLRDAGYATGGAVSAIVLRKGTGIERGFDFYDAPQSTELMSLTTQRSGAETLQKALGWLRGVGGKKFFLFLHLYEPHSPYAPPEPYASRFKNPYDAEIATADATVGQLVAELRSRGVYDQALVILLSDHGEAFGEHGENGHGSFLYRETLQVPLLVKLPGQARANSSVDSPVELADLYPTVAALLDLEVPRGGELAGRSLFSPPDPQRPLYAETFFPYIHFGWSELTSLIRGRFHYQDGPAPELYDLAADPGETQDLRAIERREAAAARQELRRFVRPLKPPDDVDPETTRQLASLGYLTAQAKPQGARPDPRSRRVSLQALENGLRLLKAGSLPAAIGELQRLVTAEPQMLDGWTYLARAYAHAGRHEEALKNYQHCLTLSEGSPYFALAVAGEYFALHRYEDARRHIAIALTAQPQDAHELLARVDMAQGDLDAARRHLDAAGAAEPVRRQLGERLLAAGRAEEASAVLAPLGGSQDVAGLDALAAALVGAGRDQEALGVLQRALAIDPRDARAYETLGVVRLRGEQPEAARQLLEKALQLDATLPVSWNTLGVARYRLGDTAGALAAWHRAVELDGGQFDALFNLGLVSAEAGRRDEARSALRRFIATAPPARFAVDLAKAKQWLARLG